MTTPRTVIFFKSYFSDFFSQQRQKVKDKILWTIRLIETQPIIPFDYFKHYFFASLMKEDLLFWRMDFKRSRKRHHAVKSKEL